MKYRVAICLALIVCCLVVSGYSLISGYRREIAWAFGMLALFALNSLYFVVIPKTWLVRAKPVRHVVKPQGIWKNASAAELDKSTTGKLLASRAHRDPGVRVVPVPGRRGRLLGMGSGTGRSTGSGQDFDNFRRKCVSGTSL